MISCEWVRFGAGDVQRVECGRRGASRLRAVAARYVYEPTLTLSDPARTRAQHCLYSLSMETRKRPFISV
ncbi:unnamed protein product [Leptosia nina]|uniref:Uncharacterized protein n=1 Tax=Leptosia nina TaxID=320188 RepID=A0AAV1JT64_9NEOP